MRRAARLAGALLMATLPLSQVGADSPYTGSGTVYTKLELSNAKKSLKYCKKPGYYGDDVEGAIQISCARLAFKTGDLPLAKTWLAEAEQKINAKKPEERKELGNLLRLQGDLLHAQGDYLKARDTYRYIYRHMLDLDSLQGPLGNAGEYVSLTRLLENSTKQLKVQVVDETRQSHPDVYPVLAALWAEANGWWNNQPRPADLSDFVARIRQVLTKDPENSTALELLVIADLYRNDCAAILRDTPAAIDHARYGQNDYLYNLIGNCQWQAGQFEAAVKSYDRVIAGAPWLTTPRENRDSALEQIEKRDHPKAFELYAAAKAGMVEFGTMDSNNQIVPALVRVEQAIALSPDFPLSYALRAKLRARDTLEEFRSQEPRDRAISADATKSYKLNPESIESIFAVGLLYYTAPSAGGYESRALQQKAMLWFNVAKTLAPDDKKSALFFGLASEARHALTWEEQRAQENANAAYVARRDQEQRDRDAALLARPREKDPCRDPDYWEAFHGRLCFGDRPN